LTLRCGRGRVTASSAPSTPDRRSACLHAHHYLCARGLPYLGAAVRALCALSTLSAFGGALSAVHTVWVPPGVGWLPHSIALLVSRLCTARRVTFHAGVATSTGRLCWTQAARLGMLLPCLPSFLPEVAEGHRAWMRWLPATWTAASLLPHGLFIPAEALAWCLLPPCATPPHHRYERFYLARIHVHTTFALPHRFYDCAGRAFVADALPGRTGSHARTKAERPLTLAPQQRFPFATASASIPLTAFLSPHAYLYGACWRHALPAGLRALPAVLPVKLGTEKRVRKASRVADVSVGGLLTLRAFYRAVSC